MAARQSTRKLAWVPRESLVAPTREEVQDFAAVAGLVVPELEHDLVKLRGQVEELHHGKVPPSKKRFINRVVHLCHDLEKRLGTVGDEIARASGHRHERADQSYAELLVLYSMLGDVQYLFRNHLKKVQEGKRTADLGRMLGAPDVDGWWQMIKVSDIVGLFGKTFTLETVRPELRGYYEHFRFDEFSL